MTYKCFCDRCGQQIVDNNIVKIEFHEGKTYRWGHYHVDCFNYEFSTDIRNMVVETVNKGDRYDN